MKHKMSDTPRIITIIGLALEGLGVFAIGITAYIFKSLLTMEFLSEYVPEADLQELQSVVDIYQIVGNILLVLLFVMLILLGVNIFLFSKLLRGSLDEKGASKVYKYQFILGIVYVFTNTIVGILYIVSGNMGMKNETDTIQTREGI
jgi:hypothetical protein